MGNIKPITRHLNWREKLSQALILFGVTMISAVVFSFVGIAMGSIITGISLEEIANYAAGNLSEEQINALKISQFFSAIGIFLIPAFIVPIFFQEKVLKYLSVNPPRKAVNFFIVILLLIAFYPLTEWLIQFNKNIDLPESLQFLENWMKQAESSNSKLIEAFLQMDGGLDLVLNILIIAITAAVTEEFFFRGLIQRMLYQWFGRVHLAIFIAAFLFSAFHLQFFGFLPRLLLGLIFGYLLYFSGNIWLPIFAHFLNNFAGVMVAFLNQRGVIEASVNEEINMEYPGFTAIISFLLGALILFYLSRINKNLTGPDDEEKHGWRKIYTTTQSPKAEIVKGVLENEGIQTVILDKKDSSYHTFGEIELYVVPEQAEEAEEIILNRDL